MFPNFGWAHATCHTAPSCLATANHEINNGAPFQLISTIPAEGSEVVLCVVYDLKDLDCAVRGARGQLLAIVVHLGIMLRERNEN